MWLKTKARGTASTHRLATSHTVNKVIIVSLLSAVLNFQASKYIQTYNLPNFLYTMVEFFSSYQQPQHAVNSELRKCENEKKNVYEQGSFVLGDVDNFDRLSPCIKAIRSAPERIPVVFLCTRVTETLNASYCPSPTPAALSPPPGTRPSESG